MFQTLRHLELKIWRNQAQHAQSNSQGRTVLRERNNIVELHTLHQCCSHDETCSAINVIVSSPCVGYYSYCSFNNLVFISVTMSSGVVLCTATNFLRLLWPLTSSTSRFFTFNSYSSLQLRHHRNNHRVRDTQATSPSGRRPPSASARSI